MFISFNKITDNIYVGDIRSPLMTLDKKIKLTHIFSFVTLPENTKKIIHKHNIAHVQYPFNDDFTIVKVITLELPKRS